MFHKPIITSCRDGEIGRRSRLKICREQSHEGSSPSLGTIENGFIKPKTHNLNLKFKVMSFFILFFK